MSERQRQRCRATTNVAIKNGVLTRGPCAVCGSTTNTDAHHTDYAEPLTVVWLCRKCHLLAHRNPSAVPFAVPGKAKSDNFRPSLAMRILANIIDGQHYPIAEVAKACKCTSACIRLLANGKCEPRLSTALALEEHFGIDVDSWLVPATKAE